MKFILPQFIHVSDENHNETVLKKVLKNFNSFYYLSLPKYAKKL